MKIRIVSWNVLHIIHELNHCYGSSPVLSKYGIEVDQSAEQTRLKDIIGEINRQLDGNTIVCLQEVPGDLFCMLNGIGDHTAFPLKYKREPKLKGGKKSPYKGTSEYLVTVVPNKLTKGANTLSVELDEIGKGALIVSILNLSIINCHAPFGKSQSSRNLFFKGISDLNLGGYIWVGDFNSHFRELKGDLNLHKFRDFKVLSIKGSDGNEAYTRKGVNNGSVFFSKLDHIIVSRVNACSTWVKENEDISDHFMIGATIFI
jgi:hypothetical protein